MAAYAALVSLRRIIDDIETHPSPPISLDNQQVESLTQIVTFLQEFLEGYKSPYEYSDEADPLEIRIMDATHAVEDVIESYIIDTIQLSAAATDEQISCIHFYQDLQNVIEKMDLIKKEMTAIKMEKEEHKRKVASDDGGLRFSPTEKKHLMVGFDDVLLQLLHRLTGGNTNRQIIPIEGMGGIGKTTLAKGAFEHKLIKDHFDICVWTTISQDYNIVETLREVLTRAGESSSSMDEKELEVRLRKCLWGRRYLIILDDMWSIDVWDRLKFSFPDCSKGSRIVVTTRMSNLAAHLAAHLTDSYSLVKIGFLDEVSSWTLFSKIVFGEQSFPIQLESIGKKIVKKCNGLPLSIVVIGGLIAKSEVTLEYWEHIEENLSSILNSENDDYCLRILKLSYNHLPVYLKPCFLYMGVFEEDREILSSIIVQLWVSEGFLKPMDNKSMTTIAEHYLKELVDRNLILVHKSGILGKVKSYKIHDLLRDLSMKEAQKQRFYYVLREQSPQGLISQQRIVIPGSTSKEKIQDALEYMPHARSYLVFGNKEVGVGQFPNSRYLRILHTYGRRSEEEYSQVNVYFQLMNSRFHRFSTREKFVIPSSINLLWNLDTIIIWGGGDLIAPTEIWKMYKLRHLELKYHRLHLPGPPSTDDDIIMMENLEVLKGVKNLNVSEDVVKRIPNIKELSLTYWGQLFDGVNYLSYLHCLSKLESLTLLVYTDIENYLQKINFPPSLKELSLRIQSNLEWEDILQTIGSLPLLEELRLYGGRFRTREWDTIEDQFQCLKSLILSECDDLEKWTMAESSHFPLLIELRLSLLDELKEIPSEIGEIPTLRSITLEWCNESVVLSAKKIIEEQEDLHGGHRDLLVRATVREKDEALQKLTTSNFKVTVRR